MRGLRSIDMHAHIEADLAASELADLGSLIFAATRSLDEAERALSRSDPWTVWGVGCHPGLAGVQRTFDADRFAGLVARTPYVSEIGLDGKSRVDLKAQRTTLETILRILQATPRVTSIHSYAATETVLDCLEAHPIKGTVLHWWLGEGEQTQRAIELGCYFSVNSSMLRHPELIAMLPLDRLLVETDHPFGDRAGGPGRRPGKVEEVERAIGRLHRLDHDEVRTKMWRNLADLVRLTKCGSLLPRTVRVTLAGVN